MSEPPRQSKRPNLTDRARADQEARRAREAAALRENLRKRKEQARARIVLGESVPFAVTPSQTGTR
jgi:uncharacterized protein YqfA (UPF0365 family)